MTNAAASEVPGSIRVARSLGRFGWGGGLVLVAALIGCLVVFESASFLGFAINGDTLHLALTVWDYSAHDYAREGFSMSRVPSIFPDIAVYAAVQLATGSWRIASLAYGGLSLLGLSVAAGFIVREIAGGGWRTATQAFLLLALLVLMLELPVTAASEHMHIFLPNNHGGPFILALAALGVAWIWLRRPANGKLLLLLALVTAGVLSDPLFVLSCIGPIVTALAYSVFLGRISLRVAMPLIVCLLLGTATARVLDLFLIRDGGIGLEWAAVPTHARAFLASFGELAAAAPLTAILTYALPLAVFLGSPLFLRARQSRAPDTVEYWWILSGSSVLATLLAVPLVYEGTWHYRYMMPLLWWPIVWTAVWLVRSLRAARGFVVSAALAGVTLMLGFAYVSPELHTPALLALHHPAEACLLEAQRTAGLKAGLGDYWHSRTIEASSDWRLQIDQIEPDGSGMWWSNDRFWYTHDIHDGAHPPVYNYIVMAGLSERAIKSHYGAPDRTLDCGGSAIWIYDDPGAVRRALVRLSIPLYATFLEAGQGIDQICIPADRFQSAAHTVGPDHLAPLEGPLEARAETPDAERSRTWGPGFGLPEGRWRIALDYSLASDAPDRDRWQITTGWGREVLYEGVLAPTEGGTRTVQSEINVKRPVQGIEIRTFLGETGGITIHGAEIWAATSGAAICDR